MMSVRFHVYIVLDTTLDIKFHIQYIHMNIRRTILNVMIWLGSAGEQNTHRTRAHTMTAHMELH